MKTILIKIRASIKFFILVSIATFFIVLAVMLLYKPIYSVNLNGELIGYCAQKSKLQAKIDELIENGNGENENIAFVQLDSMPTYNMCLLKRGITTNDDEIYQKVAENGTAYYKYYAILEDNEEKVYAANFETAESVVEELKNKDSENIDSISILEKYETELANFVEKEEAVASLYKEKVVVEEPKTQVAQKNSSKKNNGETKVARVSKASGSSSGFSTSANLSKTTVSLGVSLIKPVTGTISSRFGSISSIRSGAHTGLDIANSKGTPIKAAASGTVIWSGYKGSLGNLVVVSHTNGVQTYYGHCSKLYVSAGQTVSQGETIAAIGSTGNSTGPHLHFEIRINGVAYNPQKYVY